MGRVDQMGGGEGIQGDKGWIGLGRGDTRGKGWVGLGRHSAIFGMF